MKTVKKEVIGRAYTVAGFNKVYRPLGYAVGIFKDLETGVEKELYRTTHINCDQCNVDITQPVKEPNKPVIYVFSNGDGLCPECGQVRLKLEAMERDIYINARRI
jgi:hypothetical protein